MYKKNNLTTSNKQRLRSAVEDDALCHRVKKNVPEFYYGCNQWRIEIDGSN